MTSSYKLQMILTVSKIPVPEPMAPRKSAKMVSKPMQIPPNVAAVMMSCFNFLQVPSLVQPLKNIPSSLSLLATSLGPWPDTSIQVLLNRAQLPTINSTYIIVCIGSLIASKSVRGEVMQQIKPPTGTSWPCAPAYCQLPKMFVTKEPLKFRQSICEKKYKLETRAVCKMIGILDVQKSLMEYGVYDDVLVLLSFKLTWKPWKKITMRKTSAVANKLLMFVRSLLKNAFWIELNLLLLKIAPQRSSTMEPSYCSWTPSPILQEMGEKQLHMTVSAILIAMKRLVPELPIPYPLVMMSSRSIVIIEANVS